MATTKESMKVIAGGLDKKGKPEVVMEGKVIAVEVPDELAEAFEKLIGGMITKCEDKDNLHPEDDQNDNADDEHDDVLVLGHREHAVCDRLRDVPVCQHPAKCTRAGDNDHDDG